MLFSISTEALPVAQTALSGKIKQKTRDAMLTLSDSIDEDHSFSQTVDSILVPASGNKNSDGSDYRYLPAIFLATDSLLASGDHIDNVYTVDVWQNAAPVVAEVNQMQSQMSWITINQEEKDTVRREFISLCEKDISEERITKETIRLFEESAWESLQK